MKVKTFFELSLMITCVCRCQSSSLVVDVVELRLDDSYIFVCNVPPSTNLTRWTYLSGPTGTSVMSYQNGRCAVSPLNSFLSDRNIYSYTCNNTAYQVTVKPSPLRSRNNNIMTCKDANQLDSTGYTWIVKEKAADASCSYCHPTILFDEVEVSEGDNVTFACSVPSHVSYVNWNRNMGSNSAAMAVQNGQCTTQGTTFLDNTSKYIYTCNQTVYQVTSLNVQRSEHNDIYIFTPFGQTEGTASNWILRIVKAQVTSVTIITPPDYLVNVKESTKVELTCTTSTSRPAASVYWYRHPNGQDSYITQITSNVTTTTDYNDLSISTSILRWFVTRQDNNSNVFCTANNAVNTTELRSTYKRLFNVLYTSDDPYIVEGSEYRAIENTNGKLSCSVKGGNPIPTLSWGCNKLSRTHQLTSNFNEIVTSTVTWNVSRNHYGTCTCKSHQTGFTEKSVDVHLVVLYEATIKSFTIQGFDVTKVTVDENDTVNFICTADSNPEAVITLGHERKTLKTVTSNIVEHDIANAGCSDAGTYYCSATNIYIGNRVSTHALQLFVNCAPRAAGEVNKNIISAKNVSKTITVHVIAYPPPTFAWSQLMFGVWNQLDGNNKFVIMSSAFQSKLTIGRIGMDDFTKYRVIVTNNFGWIETTFTLSPYDIPDTPTELRQIQSHLTTSSIHIEWRPGYNGGPVQTFYIKYKKSLNSTWTYFTEIDNGEETMDISLNGLAEETQYDIVIFASNIMGNSSESPVLIVSTKASHTYFGTLVGGIAGGVTASLIIVVAIIVIFRRFTLFKECWKKRSRGKSVETDDTADKHAYYNTGRLKDVTIENNDATAYDEIGSVTNWDNNSAEDATSINFARVPNYEMINLNNIESPHYSSLDQTEQCTTNDITSENNKAVYENMKINVI